MSVCVCRLKNVMVFVNFYDVIEKILICSTFGRAVKPYVSGDGVSANRIRTYNRVALPY